MNTPNKLTILRVVLVPFFVAFLMAGAAVPHRFLIALVIFGVASYTDHLDGMLARKHNQITNFGKLMDPLADKILVISALVCFVALDLANIWLVLIIIFRELLVTSIRMIAVEGGQVIAANNWGKIKTVSQIVAIVIILMLQYVIELCQLGILPSFTVFGADSAQAFNLAGQAFLLIATAFAALSGGIYLKENWKLVRPS